MEEGGMGEYKGRVRGREDVGRGREGVGRGSRREEIEGNGGMWRGGAG